MKEFVNKLSGRLKELQKLNYEAYETAQWNNDKIMYINASNAYANAITEVNELAEEYSNDFCEWKVDGVYLMCQHKTELFVSCLEDEKYRYKHCPICGKKIKVVE